MINNRPALPTEVITSTDGTELALQHLGSGPAVVLIHGSGGGLHSWRPVADLLADRYQLWIPARRGYHPSGAPGAEKSYAEEVADLTAVLNRIGEPVHLAGMSTGATIALHAAAAGVPARRRRSGHPGAPTARA